MKPAVLVLGSNSFSGAHFVKGALEAGHQVVGISRSKEAHPLFLAYKFMGSSLENYRFYSLDLNHDLDRIMDIINEYRPGYIVNFAAQGMVAQSWDNPGHWIQTNALSAVNLCSRLKDCHFLKTFVQISTPEVYGNCTGHIDAHNHYRPSTPYAVSKAAADMALSAYAKAYDFPVVFTRAANVYGPGQLLYRIVPRTILFFLTGKSLLLHGGGHSQRSFIHIEDVVDGTLKAMEKGRTGEIFHLSTKEVVSIRALVQTIARLMDVNFEDAVQDVEDRRGKDDAYLLDCTPAQVNLGWQAGIGLETGIRQTMDWVKLNVDVLRHMEMEYVHKP